MKKYDIDPMMSAKKIQARKERAYRNGLGKHPSFNNPQAFKHNPLDMCPKRLHLSENDITDYEWMMGVPTQEHAGCDADWHKKVKF
jgi:hypothetical protein